MVTRFKKALPYLCLAVLTLDGVSQNAVGEPMKTIGRTNEPLGHITFCQTHPAACEIVGNSRAMRLDQTRWRELVNINLWANRTVSPVTDRDYYRTEEVWTFPAGYGDCEDYVILKREELIRRGWPSGSLLIAVVFDEYGDGHAVLIARTDQGDLILDNKVNDVRRWEETPYHYVKRQSISNPKDWVAVSDKRFEVKSTGSR